MALENPDELLRRSQQKRLDAIIEEGEEDLPVVYPADQNLDDTQTYFRYLDALTEGTGPFVSHLVELERLGIIMKPAELLSDKEVTDALWEVIEGLAECQVFLSCTDHLSDRELYEHLRTESLLEEHPDLPMGDNACIHLDILGACSEEDIYHYLKYYADEVYRQHMLEEFPDEPMPEHVDPPYDRDRHLPKHMMDRGNDVE